MASIILRLINSQRYSMYCLDDRMVAKSQILPGGQDDLR